MPPTEYQCHLDGAAWFACDAAYAATRGAQGLRSQCFTTQEAARRAAARGALYTLTAYRELITVRHGRRRAA